MTERPSIDLNADTGELGIGADDALLGIVTSANVACGCHAGDRATIEATVRRAKANGVTVGAHPSYPDRSGFGRRSMQLPLSDVEATVFDQIGTVAAIARANGVRLAHVKPHGALYNDAARNRPLADAIASAVRRVGGLTLVGLAGSALVDAGRAAGLPTLSEGFCDRAYECDGSLRSRELPGAMLTDPAAAAAQATSIAVRRRVKTAGGEEIALAAETLCVHGDTPGAAAIARAVRRALEDAGVRVAAPP